MNIHSKIKIQFYDYIENCLDERQKAIVDEHLKNCNKCREEFEEIQNLIEFIPNKITPSDERNETYWQNFSYQVERRLNRRKSKPYFVTLIDNLYSLFILHKKTTFAFSATIFLIFIISGIYYSYFYQIKPEQPTDLAKEVDTTSIDCKMEKYFRRSKTLLVGLTNLNVEHGHSLDMNAEQQLSRELLNEAKYIRQHPIDIESAELIIEMDSLLRKFSNIQNKVNYSDIEHIRRGVFQQNLMFKIRMAENAFERNVVNRGQSGYMRIRK